MPVSHGPAIMLSDYTRNLTGASVPFPGTAGGILRVGGFGWRFPATAVTASRTRRPGPGLRCPGRPARGQAWGLHRAPAACSALGSSLCSAGRHRTHEQDLAVKRLTRAPSRHGSNSRRRKAGMGGNLEAMAGGHAENAGVAGRQERAPAVPCRPRTHVDGQSPARRRPGGRVWRGVSG